MEKHMAVHPIEFRYFSKQMQSLFTEEAKLGRWLQVEAALAEAHAQLGHISKAAAAEISKKANTKTVKLKRVKQIESRIHHDLMACVKALTEVCSEEAGRFIHLGATSYDIEDTALALQLSEATVMIRELVLQVRNILLERSEQTKELVCIGRTHGQHAVPTTYGLKFAILACEFNRHIERLTQVLPRIKVGQMTGAVGSQASFGSDAAKLQQTVMRILALTPVMVSNQVIQRDRYAELVCVLSLIGASSGKIANEIRQLQRTEIFELAEPFKSGQVGSSAMPQKRNPHKCERICSLARIIRNSVNPALENIQLEHERDLTNSAAERIIFPECFILTDYVLRQLKDILTGLDINRERISSNLNYTGGLIMTERLMIALVEKGVGRQQAHEILRKVAVEAVNKSASFEAVLKKDKHITSVLNNDEITKLLQPDNYIGTAVQQVDAVLSALQTK
jgi:adenylosuccinate lyase